MGGLRDVEPAELATPTDTRCYTAPTIRQLAGSGADCAPWRSGQIYSKGPIRRVVPAMWPKVHRVDIANPTSPAMQTDLSTHKSVAHPFRAPLGETSYPYSKITTHEPPTQAR